MDTKNLLDSPFKKDVYEGLTSYPKFLFSKYIYDSNGDALFREIMNMEAYYLTDCEREIFQTHKAEITKEFSPEGQSFDLVELGAGDGSKTSILLTHLQEKGVDFVYKPIDISKNALELLTKKLALELPDLQVEPEQGEYFEVLDRLKLLSDRNKVIVMLGSNIGNLLHPRAIWFLTRLREAMNESDRLFMGFDQKKNPSVIHRAYSDPQGITERFNKNLLVRINRELNGDFEPDRFSHWETYDPETGTAKSFLIATEPMTVKIGKLDLEVKFHRWESIHTEISQKYDHKVINWLARKSGLGIRRYFADKGDFYRDYIFESAPIDL